MKAICHRFLKNLVYRLTNLVFRAKIILFMVRKLDISPENDVLLSQNFFNSENKVLQTLRCTFFLSNVFFLFFVAVVVVAEVSSYDKTVRKCLNPLPQLVSFVKSFAPSSPFLYPLKTSENLFLFSGGRERVHWERIG